MTDFIITGTVWLHNQAWKRGNEAALQEAGFSDEQKHVQAQRGMITARSGGPWKPKKSRQKKDD